MAYTLQALIANPQVFAISGIKPKHLATLTPTLSLCPLTAAFRKWLNIPFLPLTDEGDTELPEHLLNLLLKASLEGQIAYVEAEHFGGNGTQANVLFASGRQIAAPQVSDEAINEALRFLGVVALEGNDEFETLELGRHRDTEKWC